MWGLMAAHTPGPWREIPWKKLDIENHSKRVIVAGDYADEGEPDLIVELVAGDEVDANARLIAAGPELLEALKAAHHELTALHGLYAHDNPRPDLSGEDAFQIDATNTINKIVQAIAKAEGGNE